MEELFFSGERKERRDQLRATRLKVLGASKVRESMAGGRLDSSSSTITCRGGLFGRKKSSAPATCTLPPPLFSCRPDAMVAEQLHQFDLRLKQLEESQIVIRQPRPLPPPASSPPLPPPPPPPPPPAVPDLAPAASVVAAKLAEANMRHSCFSAEQQQRSSSAPPSSSSMTSVARLHEASLRNSLMERLRLLENRIFQLSFELDQERNSGGGSSKGTSSTTTTTATTRTRPTTTWSSSSTGAEGARAAAAEMAIIPSASSSSSSSSQSLFTLGGRLQGNIMSKKKKPANKDSKQVVVQLNAAGNANYCKKEKKRMERTRIYKRWFPLIGC